ncbi:MAG: glycogen debranching enzyme, partial [Deltaproteobacteria bacterium]|nr:glycogen debranching enzyme [Deltaproteobacteria bacterium]
MRGYTVDKSSGVKHPGTYNGLIEKIPYLKSLGITAVELLPVFEFNELENENVNPETDKALKNFWGYSTLGFLAPKASCAANGWDANQVIEFKEMVKAFHREGLKVILD